MIFFLIIAPQEEFSIVRLSQVFKKTKKQRQGRRFYLMRKRHARRLTHRRPFAHGKAMTTLQTITHSTKPQTSTEPIDIEC